MSIDHGKLLALADEMQAHLEHKSDDFITDALKDWSDQLRAIALAQPAEAVNPDLCPACKTWPVDDDSCPNCGREKPFTPTEAHQLDAAFVAANSPSERVSPERADAMIRRMRERQQSAEAVAVVEACTEAAIRESTQPSYSDESPRASWRRVVRAVLDTARNANRTDAAQEAVAWQINATKSHRGWESCTRECYEDTLRTGRYMGLSTGTRDVEVRPLYTHPQAAPAQGDGWRLVPVHPTAEMLRVAIGTMNYSQSYETAEDCYRAMLAAAPSQERES